MYVAAPLLVLFFQRLASAFPVDGDEEWLSKSRILPDILPDISALKNQFQGVDWDGVGGAAAWAGGKVAEGAVGESGKDIFDWAKDFAKSKKLKGANAKVAEFVLKSLAAGILREAGADIYDWGKGKVKKHF
ncbi:unnamed protein product [Darwinula stevensoni]|uniref:Secreted protein n=1 Tax=Darwinula stevensoni TaxID=69355 RepID=A0A7R9A682_9CRUS|nr:unnamed protein product [Darwinula stevensoni]CAG0888309.1 unnamed protein product [Darwinula stevensoni]